MILTFNLNRSHLCGPAVLAIVQAGADGRLHNVQVTRVTREAWLLTARTQTPQPDLVAWVWEAQP